MSDLVGNPKDRFFLRCGTFYGRYTAALINTISTKLKGIITVDNFAVLFNCTAGDRASDSMMAPT